MRKLESYKLELPWEIYGGSTDTEDSAFKEPGDRLFFNKFTNLLCNESLPSLFRCNPPLLSPFWVILAWPISFHLFCLQNCFSRRLTVFTASPRASFRVVNSDKTISASQEFSLSLARSTIASASYQCAGRFGLEIFQLLEWYETSYRVLLP